MKVWTSVETGEVLENYLKFVPRKSRLLRVKNSNCYCKIGLFQWNSYRHIYETS